VRYGKEVGESGTPHLQGILQTWQKITLVGLKTHFHKTCHWGDKNGAPVLFVSKADDYCAKDGDVYTRGILVKQGHRSDIQHMVKLVKEGKRQRDIADDCAHTMVKYPNGYKLMREIYDTPREPDGAKPECEVYIGPDIAKLMFTVRQAHSKAHVLSYNNGGSSTWWDGYDDQDTIIFSGELWRSDLNWEAVCSLFPYRVQMKGGSRELKARKFVFIGRTQEIFDKIEATWTFIYCDSDGKIVDKILR
jgi:hypothetical protein